MCGVPLEAYPSSCRGLLVPVSSQAFPSETPQASLNRAMSKFGLVRFSSETKPFVKSRRARMVRVVLLIVSAII